MVEKILKEMKSMNFFQFMGTVIIIGAVGNAIEGIVEAAVCGRPDPNLKEGSKFQVQGGQLVHLADVKPKGSKRAS